MQTEATNLELIEEEAISEKEVVNYLVAIGVNSSRRSYDGDGKTMYEAYVNLPLSSIVDSWDHLDQNVKLAILDIRSEQFKAWAKESADV